VSRLVRLGLRRSGYARADDSYVSSVSALLILAGDETNERTFPRELMVQVAALRKELDSDK
jgi:hypothetical protein